jgi:hypothetical protein
MSPHSGRKVKEAYKRDGIIAAARKVCNATPCLDDGSHLILRQWVRGSARGVRAVRNIRVFQTEIRVVADVNLEVISAIVIKRVWRCTFMQRSCKLDGHN